MEHFQEYQDIKHKTLFLDCLNDWWNGLNVELELQLAAKLLEHLR